MRAEARAVLAALEPGSVVCCAVSGGADSVALLHLLWGLCPPLGLTLRAAHFNHCLRGAESDGDAAFVQDLCRRWGIPLAMGRGDAAARAEATGESIEEAARALRRAFLLAQPGYIATAHNADDQVETILINLLRGTGLKGLGGMAPAAGRIVRPLLSATRADILTYLTARGLSWREDSTNALDDALRNRLRHHVLPLLRAENPSLSETVGRSAAILREEEALLAAQPGQPWYAPYVACLEGLGVDVPDGAKAATRLELLTLMGSVIPEDMLAPINTITALPDTDDETVLRFYNAGVLTGVDGWGTFAPDRTLTRAETAALVARVARPELRQTFTPADYDPFTAAGLKPADVLFSNGTTAGQYLPYVQELIDGLEADCAAAGMEFNWFNTVDGVEFLDYVKDTALAHFGVTAKDGTDLYQNFDVQVYYSRYLDLKG